MVPATRQRVRIAERSGIFLVVWVDTDRRTVDVIPLTEGNIVESVPFSQVKPLHGDTMETGSIG